MEKKISSITDSKLISEKIYFYQRIPGVLFLKDTWTYGAQVRQFRFADWISYIAWVGLMLGLLFSTLGFVVFGAWNGVKFPDYVWNVPIGTAIFVGAIAFDTIGHRTAYKAHLEKGERLVHHITIFAGITSVLALCGAYQYREFLMIPALSLVSLSIFYSVIDEWMHWKRFHEGQSDRVEMWSHYFIFLGHTVMIFAWVYWFFEGYPGVSETLALM